MQRVERMRTSLQVRRFKDNRTFLRDLRQKRALKASLGTEDGHWKGPVEEGVVWLVHSVQRPLELLVQSSMLSEQRPLVS